MDLATKKRVRKALAQVINLFDLENESDTPDYILAEFLIKTMAAFNRAVKVRDEWNNPGLDLIKLERERFAWSLETFPGATAQSALNHLKEEIKEIEKNITDGVNDAEEYADAVMLLLDSAGRRGITVVDVLSAFARKHEINKQRQWEQNPDGSYYHVKAQSHCDEIKQADRIIFGNSKSKIS